MVVVESAGFVEQPASSNAQQQQQQGGPSAPRQDAPAEDARAMLDRAGAQLSRVERAILERMIVRDGNARAVEEIRAIARQLPAVARALEGSESEERREEEDETSVESVRSRLRRALDESEPGRKLTDHLGNRVPPDEVLSAELRELLPARTLRDIGGDSARLLDAALRYDDGIETFVRALRASRHHKSARELARMHEEAERGYEEDMRQVRKRKLAALKIPKVRAKFIE